MAVELLADRNGAADVGLDGGDLRRRRGLEAQDALHDPDAAEHGRGSGAVRGDLKNAGLCHEAAAHRVRREGDFAHLGPFDSRNAVQISEAFVEEREVGIDDVARREVFVEELFDEQACFVDGGELERVVELVVVIERS